MAGPQIVIQAFYQAGTEGIAMDVAHQLQQIAVAIHQNRFKSSFE
jgi:hypothetical protein